VCGAGGVLALVLCETLLYSLTPYFVTGGILLPLLHGDTPAAVMFNTGSRKGPAVSICFIEVLSKYSNAFDQLRPAQFSSGATRPPILPDKLPPPKPPRAPVARGGAVRS
jgi:hypothetical protein